MCTVTIRACQIDRFLDLLNHIRSTYGEKIVDLKPLVSGLSNLDFAATLESGKKLFLRLAAPDYERFISRQKEKQNVSLAVKLGLSPEVCAFFDNGDEIIQYVDLPTMHPEDFNNRPDVLEKAAKLLADFHRTPTEDFAGIFDPVADTRAYETMMHECGFYEVFDGWERISAAIDRIEAALKKNPSPQCPCHCDTLAENFLYDGETIKLVDWEFSGVSDPYYDVSGVLTENRMDEKTCDSFIRAYCGGEPTADQVARIYVNRFLYCVYWAQWALALVAFGRDRDFFFPYGADKMRLAHTYLDDPKFEGYLETLENP